MKDNGNRRSQKVVLDRCRELLLCLMRGEAYGQALRDIIYQNALNEEGQELTSSAIAKRFEEDRRRLKSWFNCEISYNRQEDRYTLEFMKEAWIDLPEDAMKGLIFLDATFQDSETPETDNIRRLINFIERLLPTSRRQILSRYRRWQHRGILEMTVEARDSNTISPKTWQLVQTACHEHRLMEFDYGSPQQADGIPRRHKVEPIRYFFDPLGGHYYLEAYGLTTSGPSGRREQNQVMYYRLGRITHIQILPDKFVSNRRLPLKELVYVLSPLIAKGGVTTHIEDSQIIEREDGSVEVRAQSKSLFFDLRRLLHYGGNCRVIAGAEAVAEMKKIVQALYEQYQET